jgi:hypothetical protein
LCITEAILDVQPYEVYELVVGSGGGGGVPGSDVEPVDIETLRQHKRNMNNISDIKPKSEESFGISTGAY